MSLVTNCGLPHAALVAAVKVRPSSIQAGLAIMLAAVRFRPASGSGNHWPCVIRGGKLSIALVSVSSRQVSPLAAKRSFK